jgi:hypothetical protein
MIIAVIALIVALGGTGYAATKGKLGKNTVGPRQLKRQAVKTGKIANNAVNGRKVANNSLTGDDINLGALGTVPSAQTAGSAGNADTVGGHAAACPGGTTLIRGICFDSAPNGEVNSVRAASDGCAAKGGYLPTVMELYTTRTVLNLGTGIGADAQFTNTYYENTEGEEPRTITVDGTGTLEEHPAEGANAEYTCAYPLVR